jgi:pyrrolysine biosynthesis protein PylD
MPAYDRRLQRVTGHSLRELALLACGHHDTTRQFSFDGDPTVVIPVTSGEGIIDGFSDAVAAILNHIGFNAHVASRPDVGGLADAFECGARMVLMADDHCFSAVNLFTRCVADNSTATGRGFATALELMAGPLKDKPVLILGCGPVGRSAAHALVALGARPGLLDSDVKKTRALAASLQPHLDIPAVIEEQLDRALLKYNLILDATPAAKIIAPSLVTPRTMIAAPGVPCGLHPHAMADMTSRLIHDPLQIGVATMAVEAWLPPHGPGS